MLSREQKIKLVSELAEILQKNPSILFVDFTGLNMGELTALKQELKKEGLGWKVLKKSLAGFAFAKSGRESFDMSDHKSAVAIVYGSNESSAVMARIIHDFIIKNKKTVRQNSPQVQILGGFLLGQKMLKDTVTVLAKLPSREALLSQVLAMFMAPVSGFVRVIDAVRVIK